LADILTADCLLPADLIDGLRPIIDFLFCILQFFNAYGVNPTIACCLLPYFFPFSACYSKNLIYL
jgi:hypothetical protein